MANTGGEGGGGGTKGRSGGTPIHRGGGTGGTPKPPPRTPPPYQTPPGKDPYAAAQAHADAQAMAARRRSSTHWLQAAATITQQINALKVALGPNGLRKALNQQLANVRLTTGQTDQLLRKGYWEQAGALRDTAADNLKAAGEQSYLNLANRGRERQNAMAEATTQGAGESDLLAAQGASLRNWNANQADINRNYYDTQTSINSSLTGLTASTRQARYQNFQTANTDRNQLWTDYFAGRGDILTEIGNRYGQQAEYYGLANEQIPTGSDVTRQKGAAGASARYFRQASLATGMSYKNPGVPAAIRNWSGAGNIENDLNNDVVANRMTTVPEQRPSGAKLREWQT